MINIDFLLAGCNTRCRHCYVNGGPGPMMATGDALLCMEKLDRLAALLPDETSFTLDHEPMNHPEIARIISAAANTRNIQNYHHGMTTGVALMGRGDRAEVVRAYLDCGYHTFGITLHGSPEHHDRIVRRGGAFDAAVAAGEYLKEQGASLDVTLMLNHFFVQDADGISRVLDRLRPQYIGFVIPIFTPHRNMMDFEPYRASAGMAAGLAGHLSEWGQDEAALMNSIEHSTVAAGIRWLQDHSLPDLFSQEQEELYLSLHPDCRLYVGNSGAETQCLGDLRHIDLEEAARAIRALPGNRDYGAFYNVDKLPAKERLINQLSELPQEALFGDYPSVIYRGLTELRIPARIGYF